MVKRSVGKANSRHTGGRLERLSYCRLRSASRGLLHRYAPRNDMRSDIASEAWWSGVWGEQSAGRKGITSLLVAAGDDKGSSSYRANLHSMLFIASYTMLILLYLFFDIPEVRSN